MWTLAADILALIDLPGLYPRQNYRQQIAKHVQLGLVQDGEVGNPSVQEHGTGRGRF